MKFKFLLIALFFTLSLQLQAGEEEFNSQCRSAYNDAYEQLRTAVYHFEIDAIDNYEMAAEVAAIGLGVGSFRAICSLVEDPGNQKCVEQYKNRYKKLRKKISIGSLITNNQKKVKWNIVEDITSEFSNIFYSLQCN